MLSVVDIFSIMILFKPLLTLASQNAANSVMYLLYIRSVSYLPSLSLTVDFCTVLKAFLFLFLSWWWCNSLSLSRFPFYFELKIAFVIWLLSPYTKGSSVLYRKFVHPTLSNKEKVGMFFKILSQSQKLKCCECFLVVLFPDLLTSTVLLFYRR